MNLTAVKKLVVFLSVLIIFSDNPQLVKDYTSFKIIFYKVKKACVKASVRNTFSDSPQIEKNYTSFKIIVTTVTKLVDLPKCPKYFF